MIAAIHHTSNKQQFSNLTELGTDSTTYRDHEIALTFYNGYVAQGAHGFKVDARIVTAAVNGAFVTAAYSRLDRKVFSLRSFGFESIDPASWEDVRDAAIDAAKKYVDPLANERSEFEQQYDPL